MEKRGVRFRIHNELNIIDALKPVNIEEYVWHLENIEFVEMDDNKKYWNIEQPFIERGSSFKERLDNSEYYAIFGEIIAFPLKSKPCKVHSYEEFLSSDAELVLLIVDVTYIDIYCKDLRLVELLYQNAERNSYEKVEFIDENDPRYKLSVW
ncbi:DUF2691 family protein [Wukongibacter baidiensis]|uniref:DUF2691 family protein n=1 Tax=Wukongibacter baidiensis TaxID=1723361 RepID=UPI003D7FE53B